MAGTAAGISTVNRAPCPTPGLDAISRSDGTRASVTKELFTTKVTNGILGNFSINANGDTDANPVTIYLIKSGKQTTFKTITPPTSLVKAA